MAAPAGAALGVDLDMSLYDLVAVDTPVVGAPPSRAVDLTLVAVDSPEAESYYTHDRSAAADNDAAPVMFVNNRCSALGIPHAPAIARSELRTAWAADSRSGRGARALRNWADEILDGLMKTV